MVVNETGKFLQANQQTFTDNNGEIVTFYKLGFIPDSDHKPIELVCLKDVYLACAGFEPYDDVFVSVEVFERRGYVKTRVTYVGVPVENQQG